MTTKPDPDPLPPGTGIGRTALRVNDPDGLTGFYRDIVGLDVLCRSDTSTVLGVADSPLLVLESAVDAPERPRAGTGLFHNAFRVPSGEALGDALVRIRDGWQLEGASDHWVSEALYLTDPEGNGVEIYRDFPREKWPRSDDGTVQMSTERLDLERVEAAAGGDSRAPSGTDIGHVHLKVSSLDAFEDFYIDTLGFEMQARWSNARFVSAGGYHHHIGANTWHNRTEPVSGRGLSWFEVVLPGSGALDALRGRLADSQHTVTGTDAGFSVTDADGIEIRFRVES